MSDSPVRLLFIAGSGRSGTTLLTRILGQVEMIASVGEIRHLWQLDPARELCGCGRLFRECPFWATVFAQAFGGMEKVDFAKMYALRQSTDRIRYIPAMLFAGGGTAYGRRLQEYRRYLLALYEAVQQVSGASLILDASKDVSMLYLLLGMPRVKLFLLHQVRDSRAVAFSWMRKKRRRRLVNEDTYMRRLSPFASARAWLYRNVLTTAVRSQASGYLRLRYEDLVQRPTYWTQQVLALAGMSEVSLSFLQEGQVAFTVDNHTASGNPMRFDKGMVSLALDEAWRQKMCLRHKALVTTLTWPLLWRYGYLGQGLST